MTRTDWSEIVDLLDGEWASRDWGKSKWFARFGHLPRHIVKNAVQNCADDTERAPTVNKLAEFLPPGYAIRKDRDQHAHMWQRTEEYENPVVICETCGAHKPNECFCVLCCCSHANKVKRDGDNWAFCPDCSSMLRPRMPQARQEGDMWQPPVKPMTHSEATGALEKAGIDPDALVGDMSFSDPSAREKSQW